MMIALMDKPIYDLKKLGFNTGYSYTEQLYFASQAKILQTIYSKIPMIHWLYVCWKFIPLGIVLNFRTILCRKGCQNIHNIY